MSDREESIGRHENGSRHGSYRGDDSPRASPRRERERSRSGSRSKGSRKRYSRSSRERGGDDYRSERSHRREDNGRSGPRSGHGQADRENPQSGRCLGVFGLSIYTQESDLKDILGKYGHIEDVQIVYDAQTGRSRGFAFVYFEQERDAAAAKERCNGIEVDGRKIRVDFSITQRAHTPTPGIYMGKPTRRREGRPADSGFSGSSRGGRPRERDDYRPSYSGAGDSYRRDDSYRPPPPARDYHHSEPYTGSRAAAPRTFDDRYSGRDNGYSSSRRKSPSPYYSSSRPSSSRYRERSRSYSPRTYE